MHISTQVHGPSLADVLAFTLIEKPDDVARVERSAANRMATVRGWYGWRVANVEVCEEVDDLVRLTVRADAVGAGYREAETFEFMTDGKIGRRRSLRLDAFLAACGLTERVDDTRDILGRYFATRNHGHGAHDFGSLTNALVG